jgi:alkylation response protein AidB-like acyl-CoA dehydrogenase
VTFDPTPEQQAVLDRARGVTKQIRSAAAAIDKAGRVPEELTHLLIGEALMDPFVADEVTATLVIEELASASAGLAASLGFGSAAGLGEGGTVTPPSLAGLRGAEFDLAGVLRATGSTMRRARLVCCAVALGVGRAAVAHGVAAMKRTNIRPGGDEKVPHWALADAAAELDAARLLTLNAAQMMERDEASERMIDLAKTLSATAAEKAVEAAIRIEGVDGYARAGLLERLTRDARTLTVILP